MSFIPEDLVEQIIAKANGSSFDRDELPDQFSVSLKDGEGNQLAHWAITEEFKQNGIVHLNITNKTLNLDAQLLFMADEIREEIAANEIFRDIMDHAKNQYMEEFGMKVNITFELDYVRSETTRNILYAQGLFIMFVGLIGMIVKLKGTGRPIVVKVTGFAYSIWCMTTGILMLTDEISKQNIETLAADTLPFLISAVSAVLLKVLLIIFKLFTVVVYMFQNTMIYHPFFFRRHKKALSRWVLTISAGQSAGVFIALIAGSVALILKHEDGECSEVLKQAKPWQITIQTLVWGGYLSSLILSLCFTVGFYRKSVEKIGGSERKNIKKTMIACSIEILFDFCALIANEIGRIHCGMLASSLKTQEEFAAHCDITASIFALDGGLQDCLLKLLILQPIVQETVVVFYEMVHLCLKYRR